MANRFFDFYNDELTALRRRATRFADAYPKIAGRLRLAPDTSDDPHVERLVQSFAYSAARIRQKLEDGLPELTDGLLETLYPHFLAPVPAMSIVAFKPSHTLDSVQPLPKGTELTSEPIEGDTCRFVTAQQIDMAPIQLDEVKLMDRPFTAPPAPNANAVSCLQLTLSTTGQATLDELELNSLRLFFSGPARQANRLAQLALQHCVGLAVAAHSADPKARYVTSGMIRPAGFDRDTALIPYPEGCFEGYRILTEFAALPEKFLFFDLMPETLPKAHSVKLYLYFDALPDGLQREITSQSVRLHCTPIVNLFPARTEPVALDGTRVRYPLQADARRPLSRQVHSVSRVTLATSNGSTELCQPFFHRLTDRQHGGVFWQLRRHSAEDGRLEGATSLSFVDARANPLARSDTTASVEVLATNGALPRRLPFGGGQPRLSLDSPVDNVAGIDCLRAPTPVRRASPASDRAWQLMSHLSLNHVSLTSAGASALRGILRLYDPGDNRETAQMIDAIEEVHALPGIAKLGGVLVSGTDVELVFDEDRIDPGQAVVFGAVIDRFLGCYTTINTFTRLTLRAKDRSDALARFPARAGEEALI